MWLALPQSINFFDAAQLDEAERERFATRRHPRRRAEFAVSRALMNHLRVPADAALSLSHSDGLAAVVLGPENVAVGIDLERHKSRDILSIARFAFAPAESAALAALPEAQRLRHFYTLWVVKEALAKALPLSLADALAHCVIVGDEHGWHGTLPTTRPWRVFVFEPQADLSLAVACIGTAVGDLRIESSQWPPARVARWPLVATIVSDARIAGATNSDSGITCGNTAD